MSSATVAALDSLVVCVISVGRTQRVRQSAHAAALRFFLVKVPEDLLDTVLVANRLVEPEFQLRHAPQGQDAANLSSQEGRGADQRLGGFLARLLVAKRRIEDARLLEIRRHFYPRQGDEADAGIMHGAATQQRAEFVADLLADSVWAVTLCHR